MINLGNRAVSKERRNLWQRLASVNRDERRPHERECLRLAQNGGKVLVIAPPHEYRSMPEHLDLSWVAPERAGFSTERLERITAHIERNYIRTGKLVGCQIGILRRGYLAYSRSFGLSDRERGRGMTDDAIFRIYSMTKPITSVALMSLYEQGHFQLNDPISRYIPQWADQRVWVSGEGAAMQTVPPSQPITFRHVLSHSAGLTYGATDHPVDQVYREHGVRRGENLEEFIGKLAQVPLRYQPGERWMYSYATDVCGYLVEAISGKPLDRFFEETIFKPLGMVETRFSVPPDRLGRFAANYRREPDKSLTLIDDPQNSPFGQPPVFLSGGGGLTGTTADYLRFCEMLRRGGELDGKRILGPRTIELMRRNHLAGGQDLTQLGIRNFSETANEGVGFGLGFAMTVDADKTGSISRSDYYWGGAASTIFWIDPAEQLVVVFMTQLMPSGSFNFRGQLKNIVYSAIVE
jgi:CubicO group peptidase (beta-lactamase class C family)